MCFFTCKTFLLWTSTPQTFGTRLRVITVHQHSHPTLPASQEHSAWLLVHPNGKKEVKSCCHAESKKFTTKLAWIEERCLEGTPFTIQSCKAVEELWRCFFTSKSYITRTSKRSSQRDSQLQSRDFRFCIIEQTGLLNSPKTKMINGIMLVVLPQPFLQVFLWRCNWLVVPGAAVRNDGRMPISFWGLGFGQLKAHTSATVSHKIQNLPPDGRKVIVENGPPHAEKLATSKMIVEAGDWLTGHEANAGKHIKEAAGNTAQFAWKQRASRMYDLSTLDWPCPTRIWCICCLLHIKAASTALTSRPSAELLWKWLDGHPFVTRPQKDWDFPPRGALGKGSVRKSRISLIHVEHAAVFTFFRGITNRQSEQLLRPGFWSSNLLCTSDLLEGCKTSISILRSSKVRRRNARSNGSKAQTHCTSGQMLLIHMDSFWLKLDLVMMSWRQQRLLVSFTIQKRAYCSNHPSTIHTRFEQQNTVASVGS